MRASVLALTIMCGAAVAAVRADVWDVQRRNDNQLSTTRNELVHGSDQLHDLAALPGPVADEDWFRISQRPFSSYEVTVEGVSGDVVGRNFQVVRVASDGATILQSSSSIGMGFARSLRWANQADSVVNGEFVVVRDPVCGKSCAKDDVYRIRVSETTYAIPRFNNSGDQISVLLLQNPTDYTTSGTVYFWNTDGTAAGSSSFDLGPKAMEVLSTATVAPGTTGSITIAHDGRYGDLAGKVVGLEPATGLSFDTPLVPRAR